MSGSTVRISKESSNILREIAAQEKKSLQTILDAAIEEYRRHRFLQEANKAYSVLKENPRTGRWSWKKENSGKPPCLMVKGTEAMAEPRRGEIWLVDLNPTRGRELLGRRPALIVSVDLFNQGPAELIVVIPVTSKEKGFPPCSH